MSRIELYISDDNIFQDVALLIDRQEVINFIISIRKKCDKKFKNINKPTALDEFLRYDIIPEINEFLAKLKYPPGFTNAILAAVQNFKITNDDVRHCYVRLYGERVIDHALPPVETPRDAVLITMYPYLLKGRRKLSTDEIKKLVDAMNKYFISLPPKHPLNLDKKPEIRNARDWYWKKNNSTTIEIMNEYNEGKLEKDCIVDPNIIDQAISTYRLLLTSDF